MMREQEMVIIPAGTMVPVGTTQFYINGTDMVAVPVGTTILANTAQFTMGGAIGGGGMDGGAMGAHNMMQQPMMQQPMMQQQQQPPQPPPQQQPPPQPAAPPANAAIESVKAFGSKPYTKSMHVDSNTSVFDIITGANNPESTIPNINPEDEATMQAILDTTVKAPQMKKNQNDYQVTINIKEGGHVDKDGNLVTVALYTKDFDEALVWKKINEYVATTTRASKTKAEKKASHGGAFELERSVLVRIAEEFDAKVVDTQRFKGFKKIRSARFVVTADSLRADAYIEVVFNSETSTIYYYRLQAKTAKLTSDGRYTFQDLMNIKETNFLHAELGGKKYSGMAVILIGADTEPTSNGYVLSSAADPFRVSVIIQDGSLIEKDIIHVNPATIFEKTPPSIPSDRLIKTRCPFDATLAFLSRIDASKDAYEYVTNKCDIQFDMLSSDHQKEKMCELLLYTSLGIEARDPAAQESSVDKIVSTPDFESAVVGVLLPEKGDSAASAASTARAQSKSSSYNAVKDHYLCPNFGKLVGEKKDGRYLATEFDLSTFASIRVADLDVAYAKFWIVTTADFFDKGCGSVFYDPASGSENDKGKADVYLYDYDRTVGDNNKSKKGLCSWGWTTGRQLLQATCSDGACRSKPFFLLSGAKEACEKCKVCGAKNSFANEFKFNLRDKARFPDGLSEALVKSARHMQHDERVAEEKAATAATAATAASVASAAGSSSDPPPAKRPRE